MTEPHFVREAQSSSVCAERHSSRGGDGRRESLLQISTVIPTVGREELRRAVESVLTQDGSGFTGEVIVVNDTGRPLSLEGWQSSCRVRVVRTPRPRSRPAVGRNVGAEAATGQFLHFLDDDDWMLPGAFEAFAQAHSETPNARWLYGIVERVSREGRPLDTLPTEPEGNVLAALISGEWMPLQGTLIHRDLFEETGGFDPATPPSEDMDLLLKLSLIENVRRVRTSVCAYSEGVEESATPRHLCSVRLFEAYERIFDRPEVLDRAVDSAASPHVCGKVLRHYLISAKKALRRRDPNTLWRRLRDAALIMGGSGKKALTSEYWRAVASPTSGARP